MLKDFFKGLMRKTGYEIKKIRERQNSTQDHNAYHMAILGLLTQKREIGVVIVGANDGKINDPLYDLIRTQISKRVHLLLIEPQAELLPLINENYSFLPKKRVLNCAIGADGELDFYTIKKTFWHMARPDYAKDWPIYRAPTGIASTDKSRVVEWAKKHLYDYAPDEVIDSYRVRSRKLSDLLGEEQFFPKLDVLQVDVEGADDEVIYSLNIKRTRPAIIFFESKGMNDYQKKELSGFLRENQYSLYTVGGDTLAVSAV
jgi:FkbM family methyltransferase